MPTMRANPPGNRERGESIDRPRRSTFIFFRSRHRCRCLSLLPDTPALYDRLFFDWWMMQITLPRPQPSNVDGALFSAGSWYVAGSFEEGKTGYERDRKKKKHASMHAQKIQSTSIYVAFFLLQLVKKRGDVDLLCMYNRWIKITFYIQYPLDERSTISIYV